MILMSFIKGHESYLLASISLNHFTSSERLTVKIQHKDHCFSFVIGGSFSQNLEAEKAY